MTTDITLPSVAPTMTEGRLGNWLKQVGDAVRAGEPIAEIESEKTVTELESPVDGYLVEILVDANTEEIPVGTLLARIGEVPPAIGAAAATSVAARALSPEPGPAAPPPALVAAVAPAGEPRPSATRAPNTRNVTPLAARVAHLLELDPTPTAGTGPAGRLMLRDLPLPAVSDHPAPIVRTAPAMKPALIPHNAHRRVTARRLTEAKQRIPHFYLHTKVQADRLLQLRTEINSALCGGEEPKVSINDCVVRAVAIAIGQHPAINVAWTDEGLMPNASVDVAVAVAAPAGLVTPVLREADRLSLREIATRTRRLAERARNNALTPDEYQGGSCTVSNLGMHGVDGLYAIVNPPQSFIVGVGRIVDEPVVRDGVVTAGRVMQCTLSGDHRAIDGVSGAQLLATVRELLESPTRLLL